ncbi:MAG: sporulation integral membrane protein YtvI [Lachnospiraceae bacterium]|nr:sporulation integral membrane protein YtvI [Lachnospiraceae bacterium]
MDEIKLFFSKNKKAIFNVLRILAIIIAAYVFFTYIFQFVSPFVFGFIIYLILKPVSTFMKRRLKFKPGLSALISILLMLGIFSVIFGLAFSKLAYEAKELYSKAPSYIETLMLFISNLGEKLDSFLDSFPQISATMPSAEESIKSFASSLIKDMNLAEGSFSFVLKIPNTLLIIIFSLLSAFFFLKDEEYLKNFISQSLGKGTLNTFGVIKKDMFYAAWGYIKAQLIIMVVTFVTCLVGFLIIGSPYSLLLSLLTSIIDALPVFGSGFILWPAILISLVGKSGALALGYSAIYILLQVERQIIQPKILGMQIGLHPLAILISVFVGLKLIGVLGMIIGPVLTVIIISAYEIKEKDNPKNIK